MANKHRLSQFDVLKYGEAIAQLKAGMPRKRWQRFVKYARAHGHTVAGQLSGVPDALKERTDASLRSEARNTMTRAYKPVMAELDRRQLAAGFLDQKRQSDDADYRTWLMTETEKLQAQAHAADTTIASQQQQIASDLNANQKAAQADSLQRVAAQAGNVSDPSQSKALDFSDADAHSREQVANQRQLSADLEKIGGNADEVSRAAMIATAAVREATRKSDFTTALNNINGDRIKATMQRASDTADLLTNLRAGEVSKAQSNAETALAGAQLGIKQAQLDQDILDSNRNFRLATKKFNLAQWTAKHADLAAKAKLQLGYDQIEERQGKAAADRALKKWVAKYNARQKALLAKDKKHGVTPDERKLYRTVSTVQGLIARMHQRGVDPSKIRGRLRGQGFDDTTIDVANDLWVHGGVLSGAGRHKAKLLGIAHVGYFWTVASGSSGRPDTAGNPNVG